MSGKIRLGCVQFLNALPLSYPLETGLVPHRFEIIKDVPSALARGLAFNELDIALASTGALLELDDAYSFIPGIGICSDGPVASVCVFHNGDAGGIKRLHSDPASRTGNLLARIILRERHGVEPEIISSNESMDPAKLPANDACVLIGDNALRAASAGGCAIDLGSEWKELTELPFVYALWIGRKEFIDERAEIPLRNSMLIGKSMIRQIVESRDNLPLPPELAENYLRENIEFDVTDAAEAGLAKFLKLAGELT